MPPEPKRRFTYYTCDVTVLHSTYYLLTQIDLSVPSILQQQQSFFTSVTFVFVTFVTFVTFVFFPIAFTT